MSFNVCFLLLENVPGLLNHDSGRTFAAILSTLDELGYDVAWQVHYINKLMSQRKFLSCAAKTVAHNRNRVFIIGSCLHDPDFIRAKCAGKVLSFTDANPKTLC